MRDAEARKRRLQYMEQYDLLRLLMETTEHDVLNRYIAKALHDVRLDNPGFHPKFMQVFRGFQDCEVVWFKLFILMACFIASNRFFAFVKQRTRDSEFLVDFFRDMTHRKFETYLCKEDAFNRPSKHPDVILYPSIFHLMFAVAGSWRRM